MASVSYSQGFITKQLRGTDTTDSVLDSLTRHYTDSCDNFQSEMGGLFDRWYLMTIAVDDTVYLSSDATFPANNTTTLYPDETETFGDYWVFSFQQWFIKSNSDDVVTYRYWFLGD